MGKEGRNNIDNERKFVSHNEKIIRKQKIGIAIKALAISVSLLGVAGITSAIVLHFAVPSNTTITSLIEPTATSSSASLVKVDSKNVLRKTTDDQALDVVLTTGSLLTGRLSTTKGIGDFDDANEFVTKAYVDSVYQSNAATANSSVRQSYVDSQVATALPLSGGEVTGPVRTNRVTFDENEFVTKQYVSSVADEKIPLSGGELTGPLTTNRQNNEFGSAELVTKSYVDQEFGRVEASIQAMITNTRNSLLPITGGTLTGALKTTRNTFEDDEIISKKYVDTGINSALYQKLTYKDTSPAIPSTTSRFYVPHNFTSDAQCRNNLNNFSWSGWMANGDSDGTYLTDDARGLATPANASVFNFTGNNRRGLLNFFGVEYELAKRIEEHPEGVKIAFRLQDVRTTINRSVDTPFYDLGSLNDTVIATQFTDPNGQTYNYKATATYDKDTKQFYLKSEWTGDTNCFVSIAGIVLGGKTRSSTYELLNGGQSDTPYFRES